jgi:hypothetical protein
MGILKQAFHDSVNIRNITEFVRIRCMHQDRFVRNRIDPHIFIKGYSYAFSATDSGNGGHRRICRGNHSDVNVQMRRRNIHLMAFNRHISGFFIQHLPSAYGNIPCIATFLIGNKGVHLISFACIPHMPAAGIRIIFKDGSSNAFDSNLRYGFIDITARIEEIFRIYDINIVFIDIDITIVVRVIVVITSVVVCNHISNLINLLIPFIIHVFAEGRRCQGNGNSS